MRILAVDDDPVMLDVLGVALEGAGFDDITFAATAEDALELIDIAEHPYDVFLLDIMLPGTSGIEVCRALRCYPRYRATPVLMITASRARDMMARAFEAGATDFVSKPFDALELVTRIRLAAMLNDSLQREQMNAAAIDELSQLSEISFDERFDLTAGDGIKGFLALENDLLRGSDTLYEMVIFAVEINNALGLYRGSRPAQFRASIDAVGRVLGQQVDAENTRFAYAGRGDMIAVAHAQARIDLADLQSRTNAALTAKWDSFATGQSQAPTLNVRRIDGPPAWSGKAAASILRSFQGRADLSAQADPSEVDGLFERLSVRIASG